jgi:hypothetical protein
MTHDETLDGTRPCVYLSRMRTNILSRIAECRADKERLERELLVVNARLETYEDVLRLLPGVSASSGASTPAGELITAERRSRRMSAGWKAVLQAVKTSDRSVFTIDNVLDAGRPAGFAPTRGNVRSQMAAYIDRGIIERVGQGHFRLTPAGEAEIGAEGHDEEDDGQPPAGDEHISQPEPLFDAASPHEDRGLHEVVSDKVEPPTSLLAAPRGLGEGQNPEPRA